MLHINVYSLSTKRLKTSPLRLTSFRKHIYEHGHHSCFIIRPIEYYWECYKTESFHCLRHIEKSICFRLIFENRFGVLSQLIYYFLDLSDK